MTDFLIVYGAIALLLTMSGAGAWLGHSIVQEVLRRLDARSEAKR